MLREAALGGLRPRSVGVLLRARMAPGASPRTSRPPTTWTGHDTAPSFRVAVTSRVPDGHEPEQPRDAARGRPRAPTAGRRPGLREGGCGCGHDGLMPGSRLRQAVLVPETRRRAPRQPLAGPSGRSRGAAVRAKADHGERGTKTHQHT